VWRSSCAACWAAKAETHCDAALRWQVLLVADGLLGRGGWWMSERAGGGGGVSGTRRARSLRQRALPVGQRWARSMGAAVPCVSRGGCASSGFATVPQSTAVAVPALCFMITVLVHCSNAAVGHGSMSLLGTLLVPDRCLVCIRHTHAGVQVPVAQPLWQRSARGQGPECESRS
jgi:hypothetical protein